MTLPNKRPVLLPTKRELKYLATFLLGGWVFLGVRELLSHLPHRPSEAERFAATARAYRVDNQVFAPADVEIVCQTSGDPARTADFLRKALHRHDGEKWGRV